jgi:hypothetical protein
MAYIKISDPSVIDVAAWQQVINVVNQHSDSINSLTNVFGLTSTPDWDATDYVHQYDASSQQILFGRAKAIPTTTNNGTLWYDSVTFTSSAGVAAFRATPIVSATAYSGNTSNAVSTSNDDVIVSVYNVSPTGFKYRLLRAQGTSAGGKAITGNVYVNWVAIGPK